MLRHCNQTIHYFGQRLQSTLTSPPKIYLSKSLDPYFNLSFEEWLFRKTDVNQIILFFYVNKPCVVIGRNQNPWKEIDTRQLSKLGLDFVRRRSGGGTVYHDEGNTNYSVMVPRLKFDRRSNAQLVSRALNTLRIESYVNERHDICVNGLKVSGSAFKLVNHRAYHHGTMLIDARLENLRGVLKPLRDRMITKGVESVPSPVSNLRRWSSTITHSTFVQAVSQEFKKLHDTQATISEVDESILENNQFVKAGMDELETWDWKFGQTPEFVYTIPLDFLWGNAQVVIHSKHGTIVDVNIEHGQADEMGFQVFQMMGHLLTHQRYAFIDIPQTLRNVRDEHADVDVERVEDVLQVICNEM